MKRNNIIPTGWKYSSIKNLITNEIKNGYSPNCPEEPNGRWILSLGNLTETGFDPSPAKPAPIDDIKVKEFLLESGDFLISRSNSLDKVGRAILFRGEIENCSYPDLLMKFRVNESQILNNYLEAYLKSSVVRNYIQSCAAGTSNSMVKINKSVVEKIPVLLPPLPEQKAIADVLSTWDAAIEKTERLIKAKERRFRGLMQGLLKPKPEWRKVKIGSFLTESRIAGSNGLDAKKLTVKLYGNGVVAKNEKRLGSETTNYFLRRSGQFIYSKLDFLNGAFGVIPEELDGYESTLDLPAFDFSPEVCREWFLYFVTRPEYYTKQIGLAKGQRKARRVSPSEFLGSKIPLPSIEEQRQIACKLSLIEREFVLQKLIFEQYKTQKRGLMQKLLTGEWRVVALGQRNS